jgi:hypothetical protein
MLQGLSRGFSSIMDFNSEYLLGMVCRHNRNQAILDGYTLPELKAYCRKTFMLA